LGRPASTDPARARGQERGQVTVDQEARLRLPVFHEAIDDEAGIELATDQFCQAVAEGQRIAPRQLRLALGR